MKVRRIAILTSGGDAPGMNAAIRAAVRVAIAEGFEVFGVLRGYRGLIEGTWRKLELRDVSGVIERGGTMLMTAREPRFRDPDWRKVAYDKLTQGGIDGLIVIGGNGSFKGAYDFFTDFQFPVVCIPATIDNDISGTDYAIGFDTAVNNAISAIDKIRDTASAFERVFVVEVMGRRSGFIALHVGIATGAEVVLIPEIDYPIEKVANDVIEAKRKGKRHVLIIVAEGVASGSSVGDILLKRLEPHGYTDIRVTVLGYIQRGGNPTAFDRLMASRMGAQAVHALARGEAGVMAAFVGQEVVTRKLETAVSGTKKIEPALYELARKLAM
ncbi:MAG: 6-phosphofructokinase [Candidatus Hydrothermota bacterium]|nr:MAG: 6-phosphofructokinase [Candidatus Hydrothermae bacterium]